MPDGHAGGFVTADQLLAKAVEHAEITEYLLHDLTAYPAQEAMLRVALAETYVRLAGVEGLRRDAAEHDAGTCPTCGARACVGRLDYEDCTADFPERENRASWQGGPA